MTLRADQRALEKAAVSGDANGAAVVGTGSNAHKFSKKAPPAAASAPRDAGVTRTRKLTSQPGKKLSLHEQMMQDAMASAGSQIQKLEPKPSQAIDIASIVRKPRQSSQDDSTSVELEHPATPFDGKAADSLLLIEELD